MNLLGIWYLLLEVDSGWILGVPAICILHNQEIWRLAALMGLVGRRRSQTALKVTTQHPQACSRWINLSIKITQTHQRGRMPISEMVRNWERFIPLSNYYRHISLAPWLFDLKPWLWTKTQDHSRHLGVQKLTLCKEFSMVPCTALSNPPKWS